MKKLLELCKRGIALLCAAAMLTGIIPGISIPVMAAEDAGISTHAPTGLANVALGKEVSTDDSTEKSSYGWGKTMLVDGKLGEGNKAYGWSTNVLGGIVVEDQEKEASVQVNLGNVYEISQFGLFPRNDTGATYGTGFPMEYTVEVSSDGTTWSIVYTGSRTEAVTAPVIVNLEEAVKGQYVKLHVTKRDGTYVKGQGYLVQLAELAVWGELATADYTAVDAAIKKAEAIDRNLYTSDSLAALDAAVAEVERGKPLADQETVNGYATAIEAAIQGLVKATADYTAVDAAIEKAEAIDRNLYTSDSLAALDAAVAEVERGKLLADQETVNGYATAIEAAINDLEAKDRTNIAAWAPAGLDNLALNKTVTAESSTETSGYGWGVAKLVDGILGSGSNASGWSTKVTGGTVVDNQETPSWVQVDLGSECEISQIGLFPRSDSGEAYGTGFPMKYTVEVSSDGTNWSIVYTGSRTEAVTAPAIVNLEEAVKGQYVKVNVIKRDGTYVNGQGYLVQLSELAVWGSEAETPQGPVKDRLKIEDWAPEGFEHIAIGKTVTASSSHDKWPQEGWHKSYLVDGILASGSTANGWSTSPFDGVTDPNTPAWVTIDLDGEYDIKQVGLFPRSDESTMTYGTNFPVDFLVQVSLNGEDWSEIYSATGTSTPEGPVIVELEETVRGRYVQLYVSKRVGEDSNNDGKLVQLSEMAVWGKGTISLNKSSIRLVKGESDEIKAENTEGVTVVWSSDDESIATVDQNGKITAVAVGKTTIHAKVDDYQIDETVAVEVVEKKTFDYEDNILISIFWPPTLEYLNSGEGDEKWVEQYKLLADADIDFINNVETGDLTAKSTNLKMLEYAAKYGMVVSVADARSGRNLLKMTADEIKDMIAEYENIPGLGGYYILDEPNNANPFLDTYVAMKEADEDAYMHLNFRPYYIGAYGGNVDVYKAQTGDWLRLSEAAGYPQEYLMYDLYPYPDNSTGMNRERFHTNLQAVYEVGKESDVKTATYLQSVRIEGTYRSPSVAEIRYEAMMALAYGYKQVSYFTWFTPSNRPGNEEFADGIILVDGRKNEKLYDGISALNKEIHALGNVLIDLDAEEVYLNGDTWGMESIPTDFFAQPVDNTNYTVSFLRNEETGRNYMMVVNNDYSNSATIKLNMDAQITSLLPVSHTDGTLGSNALTNGTLEVALEAGDGMLYALPEGVDFYDDGIEEQEAGQNLALDAYILANTSTGDNREYISNLNDGTREKTSISNGWKSADGTKAVITMDLQTERKFNRLDIYPQAEGDDYLPKTFDILVSEDGISYTTVKSVSDFGAEGVADYVTFDEQTARYIKLDIQNSNGSALSIGELEVYLDDGTVLDPGEIGYTEGDNIALKKPVSVSSVTENKYGWALANVNDGNTTLSGGEAATGWTSQTGKHKTESAEEWVMIDLGLTFDIDTVKLLPKGSFAIDYTIEISDNGEDGWKEIASVTNDDPTNKEWRTFDVSEEETITGRYLRVKATKLACPGSVNDGYLMQIGEIEAYGTPVTDKTEAKEVLVKAEELKDEARVDTTALEEAMQALSDAIDSNAITQTRLDKLVDKVKAEMEAVEKAEAEHTFKEKLEYDENGHWTVCEHCDDKFKVEDHTFGEWTQTKAPTTTEKGVKERTCSACGYKQTEDIGILENTNKGDSSSNSSSGSNSNSSSSNKDNEPVEVHYANGTTTTTTAANAKTGDSAMIAELCAIMLVCMAGIVFVYVKRRKKDIS